MGRCLVGVASDDEFGERMNPFRRSGEPRSSLALRSVGTRLLYK